MRWHTLFPTPTGRRPAAAFFPSQPRGGGFVLHMRTGAAGMHSLYVIVVGAISISLFRTAPYFLDPVDLRAFSHRIDLNYSPIRPVQYAVDPQHRVRDLAADGARGAKQRVVQSGGHPLPHHLPGPDDTAEVHFLHELHPTLPRVRSGEPARSPPSALSQHLGRWQKEMPEGCAWHLSGSL